MCSPSKRRSTRRGKTAPPPSSFLSPVMDTGLPRDFFASFIGFFLNSSQQCSDTLNGTAPGSNCPRSFFGQRKRGEYPSSKPMYFLTLNEYPFFWKTRRKWACNLDFMGKPTSSNVFTMGLPGRTMMIRLSSLAFSSTLLRTDWNSIPVSENTRGIELPGSARSRSVERTELSFPPEKETHTLDCPPAFSTSFFVISTLSNNVNSKSSVSISSYSSHGGRHPSSRTWKASPISMMSG